MEDDQVLILLNPVFLPNDIYNSILNFLSRSGQLLILWDPFSKWQKSEDRIKVGVQSIEPKLLSLLNEKGVNLLDSQIILDFKNAGLGNVDKLGFDKNLPMVIDCGKNCFYF